MDIDLGQRELIDDVLSVDVHMCVAQYVTSVCTTTPLPDRAGAVFKAIENVKPIGSVLNPTGEMEGASAGEPPDLGAFLPRWVKHLGRRRPSKNEWESDHERWLREAVLRLEGADGLERLARNTKRPQTCLAWCQALVDRGDWAAALHAYDDSVVLVGKSHWRGELLDGAALAAQQLKQSDLAERPAAAWHAAPTLPRLLRWLVTEDRSPTALRLKARTIVSRCPKTTGRQLGLLRLLACISAPQPTCCRGQPVLAGRAMSIRVTYCSRRPLSCWHTKPRGACRTRSLQISNRDVAIRWRFFPMMTSSGDRSWVRPPSPW